MQIRAAAPRGHHVGVYTKTAAAPGLALSPPAKTQSKKPAYKYSGLYTFMQISRRPSSGLPEEKKLRVRAKEIREGSARARTHGYMYIHIYSYNFMRGEITGKRLWSCCCINAICRRSTLRITFNERAHLGFCCARGDYARARELSPC